MKGQLFLHLVDTFSIIWDAGKESKGNPEGLENQKNELVSFKGREKETEKLKILI